MNEKDVGEWKMETESEKRKITAWKESSKWAWNAEKIEEQGQDGNILRKHQSVSAGGEEISFDYAETAERDEDNGKKRND